MPGDDGQRSSFYNEVVRLRGMPYSLSLSLKLGTTYLGIANKCRYIVVGCEVQYIGTCVPDLRFMHI